MTKRGSKNGNYEIGHGKTPKYTRYKPGQSGNPKGRPKKNRAEPPSTPQSEFDDILRAELDRTVTVNEGGKTKKMNMRGLVPRAQIKLALQGNAPAQQHVMRAIRDLEERDREREAAAAEAARLEREEEIRLYEFMVWHKAERTTIWAEAEAQGIEPEQPWPHPDDILLSPEHKKWRVRGPYFSTCLPKFEWLRAERDHMYAVAMQEIWTNKKQSPGSISAGMLTWFLYDVQLPLRWQIAERSEVASFNLAVLTKKQLQAEIDARERRAKILMVRAGFDDKWDKESYRQVNSIMKPLLKARGFRSLAEFHHAYEIEQKASN